MSGLSRRSLLGAGGAGILASLSPIRMSEADPLGLPIGIQSSTVQGDLTKDFDGTVKALAAIGYRRIEHSLPPEPEAKAALRVFQEHGLLWDSAHIGGAQELLTGLEAKLDLANKLGLKYLVCTFLGLRDPSRVQGSLTQNIAQYVFSFSKIVTLDDWAWTADTLNKAGEMARKASIRLAYHNEPIEFREFGSVVGYDTLVARTEPDLVSLEFDCGNAVAAGADPVAYIEKYAARIILLHVKDVKRGHKPSTYFTPETRFDFTEIGSGSVDWRRVFEAAKKAQLEEYFVEQGPPFERPPLESARISHDYLRGLSV